MEKNGFVLDQITLYWPDWYAICLLNWTKADSNREAMKSNKEVAMYRIFIVLGTIAILISGMLSSLSLAVMVQGKSPHGSTRAATSPYQVKCQLIDRVEGRVIFTKRGKVIHLGPTVRVINNAHGQAKILELHIKNGKIVQAVIR